MQDQSQSKTSGSRKKRFEVIPATTRPDLHIDVGKGERKFGSSGMVISDPGEAEAIDQKYGSKGTREVVVMGVDDVVQESGHTYQFSFMGVPWAKYDEFGRRVYDEEESQEVSGDEEKSTGVGGRADDAPSGRGQEAQASV